MPTEKTVPYLYRARLKSADGREAMSPFVIVHDAGGQGRDPGATVQMYRFKVRTADGSETISKIVIAHEAAPESEASRRIHLVMQGGDGVPHRTRRFRIEAEGKTFEGTTDDAGVLDQDIPRSAAKATLTLLADNPSDELIYHLQFGDLPPVTEIAGLQARLNALGLHAGSGGTMDEHTISALKEFQEHHMHRDHPSGEPDDETRAQLEREHAAH
jgi:hypothetical protein